MAKYKIIECKGTVETSIDDGLSDIESLQEEMDSWASGMEDGNLANSEKCQTVRETADTLQSAYDDAGRAFEEIREKISELFDGVPEKPGCKPHVLGQKCKRCGWSGVIQEGFRPTIEILDPPKKRDAFRIVYGSDNSRTRQDYVQYTFAVVAINQCCTQSFCSHDLITSEEQKFLAKKVALESAKAEYDKLIKEYEKSLEIPKEISTVPAVDPVLPEDSLSPLEHEVTWTESRPYGRHVSRSNRLSAAMAGISAGVNGMREWLASYLANNPEADWTSEISDNLDQIEESLGECENVDFPGMYG